MEVTITVSAEPKLTLSCFVMEKKLLCHLRLSSDFRNPHYTSISHTLSQYYEFFPWITCCYISIEGGNLVIVFLSSVLYFSLLSRFFFPCCSKSRAKNSDTFGHKLPYNFPRLLSLFLCRPCTVRQ